MGKVSDTEKIKKVKKKDILPTKVVIRRLPAGLTDEEFRKQLGDIPEHDFFSFHGPDYSLETACFSRAYISFVNFADIHAFKYKFDHHAFVTNSGMESHAVVEFAQFQGIPKPQNKRRRDPRSGTIEKDPDYIAFLESLDKEKEPAQSAELYLEQLEARKAESKAAKEVTPLLEYIKSRRAARNANKHSSNDKRSRRDHDPDKDGRSRKKTDESKKGPGKKTGAGRPSQGEKPSKDGRKPTEGSSTKSGTKKNNEKYSSPEKDQSGPKGKSPKKYPNKSNRPASARNPASDKEKGSSERPSTAQTSSTSIKSNSQDVEKILPAKDEGNKAGSQEPRRSKEATESAPRDRTKRKNRDRPEIAIYRPPSRPNSGKNKESKGKDRTYPKEKDKQKASQPE